MLVMNSSASMLYEFAMVQDLPSEDMNSPPFCHEYRYSQLLPKLGMKPAR